MNRMLLPLVLLFLARRTSAAVCADMYLVLGSEKHAVMEDRVGAAAYEIFRTRHRPGETCVTLAGKHKLTEDRHQARQSNPEAFVMFNLFHDAWTRLELEWGAPRSPPLVLVEHQSTNTAENLVCAARLWRQRGVWIQSELTVVTSDFHVDRSMHLAEAVFQDDPVDDAYRFFFDDEMDPPADDDGRALRVIGSTDMNVPVYALDLEPLHLTHVEADVRRARLDGVCM